MPLMLLIDTKQTKVACVVVVELMLFSFKLNDIVIVSLHSPVQDTVTSQVIVYSVVLPITETGEGV